jgi:hypothetical protein
METTITPPTAPLETRLAELETLLVAERAALEDERQARQRDRDAFHAQQRDRAVASGAQAFHAVDPNDVIAWAAREQPDALASVIAADGSIDPDAVDALVAACRGARPHYFRSSAPGSPSNSRANAPQDNREALDRALGRRKLFNL